MTIRDYRDADFDAVAAIHDLAGSCDPRGFTPLASDKPAWLYVDPTRYGGGIGRALLRLALGVAGADAWPIALEGNARARALYESEGFAAVKTFPGENNGYPCICVRMALRAGGAHATSDTPAT